jgi:predicted lipoprotein
MKVLGMKVFCCLGLLAGFAVVGCSTPENSAQKDIRRTLLEGLGNQIFVPRYAEFEKLSQTLADEAKALCAAPSDDALGAARDAWWAARAPLKRNELLYFGPFTDAPLRIGPKVDFWPARPDDIEALLASREPLDVAAMDARSASERGTPAIEYLLYVLPTRPVDTGMGGASATGGAGMGGMGGSSPAEPAQEPVSVEEAFAKGSERCLYLTAATGDLAVQAAALRKAWDPKDGNYLSNLVDAGRDKQFTTIDLALGEVVNRLAFVIANIRGEKLGVPAGRLKEAQPDTMESRFSGRTIEDVRDNLRGVEEVIFGADVSDAASIAGYLKAIDQGDLVPELQKAIDQGYDLLDAIDDPLREHYADDQKDVFAAIDGLAQLQTLIQVDMIHAMALKLTFNDIDGD